MVLAQVDEREQLEPGCLLGPRLLEGAPDRGAAGLGAAVGTRDRGLEEQQLRQIHPLAQLVRDLQCFLELACAASASPASSSASTAYPSTSLAPARIPSLMFSS